MAIPQSKKSFPERNREVTQKRLIEAVGSPLAEKGFTALGVNAVARQAGVDKVLIYRYFGGLPGLITAFGRDGDFWPSIEELAGGDLVAFGRLSLPERLSRLGKNFTTAIRRRPLTQEIMAWEMVERNDLTVELEVLRESIFMRFLQMFFPQNEMDVDLEAISAIIGAGISYLVTRSRYVEQYSGVDLQSEKGWQRLEKAVDTIVYSLVAAMPDNK